MTDDHLLGDWAVCNVGGAGGKLISLGEYLDGSAFGPWDHAFVYLGDGKILQAEPGGSRIADLGTYGAIKWWTGPLSAGQRAMVPAVAKTLTGIPYSALDYFALVAHRLHEPDLPMWPEDGRMVTLEQFIGDSGHMICSQLVDEFMLRIGCHLFRDGRWPGYVTPADLAALITTPEAHP